MWIKQAMHLKLWFCACAVLIASLSGAHCQRSSKAELLSRLAGHLGFSPVCVAFALATCQDPSGSLECNPASASFSSSSSASSSSTPSSPPPSHAEKLIQGLEGIVAEMKTMNSPSPSVILDETIVATRRRRTYPRHCQELKEAGDHDNGVREIFPYRCCPLWGVQVYCDQETDGGGWTLLQRRGDIKPREDFYRMWGEYRQGFGNLSGEFWLGLDVIHHLTSEDRLQELRIDLTDFEGVHRVASYGFFQVGGHASNFVMHCSRYTGNSGDSLTHQSGAPFSTHDRDNDVYNKNCAELHRGAWWYKDCHKSNLNGLFLEGAYPPGKRTWAYGIEWHSLKDAYFHPLRDVTMMIRPAFR